jgi:hypothetical protein
MYLVDIYGNIDFWGITVGIVALLLALSFGYYLLQKFDLNKKEIVIALLLSGLGHFAGGAALYYFSITAGSDSYYYFHYAIMKYQGLGYWIAFLVLGYLKHYILGESFLGAFLISGALGSIGSVYYLLTYKTLLDRISGKFPLYRIDPMQLTLPALLLLCWPSYFFWSAALVKDNFAFLGIGMLLFSICRGKWTLSNLSTFAIGFILGFSVRPYLFIVFSVSATMYILLGSKWNIFLKTVILFFLAITTFVLIPFLSQYAAIAHFSGSNLSDVGKYAVQQQKYMHLGSSIPVPTSNPHLTFLFLPYLALANLLLPLGVGARNFIGYISSAENAYLLWWIIVFYKSRAVWSHLKNKLGIVKFLLIYSIFGMSCLSIMNSNLGLAMREKMMYVPALLICIFLTYSYRRMLIIQYHCEQVEQNNHLVAT